MQVNLEKRLSHGLYLLSNWTWSHGLDNALSDGGVPGPVPQDPLNRRADWGTSNSDIRHRVNVAATYRLPFGRGHGAAAQFVRDWQVGEVLVVQSGLPFTVTVPGSPSNTGASSRANPVVGVSPAPSQQSITQWFNPAAFAIPPAYTWGTLARDSLNGPRLVNLDTMVSRTFRLGEHRDLDFRWELFNAANHPQFGLPASTIGVGGVATITSTQRANRQMQFALRLAF
jgi:hypothetical protein